MGLVKEWFKLESDLEDEVLERYRTKERQAQDSSVDSLRISGNRKGGVKA